MLQNMDTTLLYSLMQKRKSFHTFKENRKLNDRELAQIESLFTSVEPLDNNCQLAFRLVDKAQTSCGRGEYCILVYSNKAKNYLLNVGYAVEQLDLLLTALDIGVCWYGMGRTQLKTYKDLEFVTMLNIQKVEKEEFRPFIEKTTRKTVEEIWQGDKMEAVSNIVRFAPSACNTQPWRVLKEGNSLTVTMNISNKCIIPVARRPFFAHLDCGIFLLFLELCLRYSGFSFTRELVDGDNLIARYEIKKEA